MGFFDSVSEAGRGLGAAARDAAKTAQLNVRLKDLDGRLHKQYEVIGQKYYKAHPDENTPEHKKIKEIFAEIAATKDQLADIRGQNICPNCGEFVERGSRYCNHCGADLQGSADDEDETVDEDMTVDEEAEAEPEEAPASDETPADNKED